MNASVHTRQPRDFLGALSTTGPRRPVAIHSNQRNAKWFAESVNSRREVAMGLANIAWKEFGYRFEVPPLPLISAGIAAGKEGRTAEVLAARLEEFDEKLDSQLRQCPYFGRATYAGPHECVFTFFDATKRHALMQTTHQIVGHEHHLVQVRERKLTDTDVVLPEKQRRMVRALPAILRPNLRIITGLLVLKKEQNAGVIRHDHAVGTGLRRVGRAALKYGPGASAGVAAGAVAAGIVTGVMAMVHAAAATAATVAVVAVADPALVIGDLVISGWIDGTEVTT